MIEHYSPRDIFFTREQMIWLIEWLSELEKGNWPPYPRDTGYTEMTQSSHSHRAPFETAAQFFCEVTARMFPTDENGKIIDRALHEASGVLKWEVQHGLTDYALLCPAAKKALNYISGWRRRKNPYSKWKYEGIRKIRKKS